MHQHHATGFEAAITANRQLKGDYHILQCAVTPQFEAAASPGQFVHVRLPQLEAHLLRRPFSICDCTAGTLTLVYKVVGSGTAHMARLRPGDCLDLLGPLGHGFTLPGATAPRTIMLGGGYGCAAMYFYARRLTAMAAATAPLIMLGARSAADILLAEEFRALGCEVLTATDDGSCGEHGRITVLLDKFAATAPPETPYRLAACGPMPMLRAIAKLAEHTPQWSDCEISLDEIMCCGVGACFGCVVKCISNRTPRGWEYRRSCLDGPVFKAQSVYWQ